MKTKQFKRWWIPAIGYVLAGGFFNNLLVAPFVEIRLIEWSGLVTSLGILLGISGIRDYFTKDSLDKLPENVSGKKWKRYWIPGIGWFLCGAYFINCILAPYLDFIRVNDWTWLIAILSTMLGISGYRDIKLTPKCPTCGAPASAETDEAAEKE